MALSLSPKVMSAVVEAPASVVVPVAVRLVNVPAAAEAPPMVAPSTVPPLMSAVVAVTDVKVAAAGVAPPITVPSIAPPLMSAVGMVTVPVKVGDALGAARLNAV